MHTCLLIKIKSNTNTNIDTETGLIAANNFFANGFKQADIKRYRDDIPILPINNVVEVYRSFDVMLKHMPEKSLKTYEETLIHKNMLDLQVIGIDY